MEDRLEIWLELIAGKLDRLIELGENVERASRLQEMLEDLGEHQADHFVGADKMVADEPPKKWRILEPGEVVQEGDRMNAKLNPPSDPPNGLGWIPVIASVGATVCEDDPGIFARPVAEEPAKEPVHPAGPKPDQVEGGCEPTEKDIGGGVEVIATASWIHGGRSPVDEPAKEPEPSWEPKVGDWVRVTRPVDWIEWEHPKWEGSMHQFDGKVGQIECEWEGHFQIRGFAASNEFRYQFHRHWLSPAEPPAKEPEPAWEPKVGDWVRVTRPENWKEWGHPCWAPQMHQFDGKVGKIESEWGGRFHICGFAWPSGLQFIFHRDWLSPAEPPKDEYREPVLPADAGQYCQFSDDGIEWRSGWLNGWVQRSHQWVSHSGGHWRHCRIKKES